MSRRITRAVESGIRLQRQNFAHKDRRSPRSQTIALASPMPDVAATQQHSIDHRCRHFRLERNVTANESTNPIL
jgi:hypothetical protein